MSSTWAFCLNPTGAELGVINTCGSKSSRSELLPGLLTRPSSGNLALWFKSARVWLKRGAHLVCHFGVLTCLHLTYISCIYPRLSQNPGLTLPHHWALHLWLSVMRPWKTTPPLPQLGPVPPPGSADLSAEHMVVASATAEVRWHCLPLSNLLDYPERPWQWALTVDQVRCKKTFLA